MPTLSTSLIPTVGNPKRTLFSVTLKSLGGRAGTDHRIRADHRTPRRERPAGPAPWGLVPTKLYVVHIACSIRLLDVRVRRAGLALVKPHHTLGQHCRAACAQRVCLTVFAHAELDVATPLALGQAPTRHECGRTIAVSLRAGVGRHRAVVVVRLDWFGLVLPSAGVVRIDQREITGLLSTVPTLIPEYDIVGPVARMELYHYDLQGVVGGWWE